MKKTYKVGTVVILILLSLFILGGVNKDTLDMEKFDIEKIDYLESSKDNDLDLDIESALSKEKIFITLGDSITARDKQVYGGVEEPYIGYQQIIKEELNMDRYFNLGISGATIARGTEYLRGLSKLVNDFTFDGVDFIIVSAGTNDFALGVPLGDKEEIMKDNPDRYTFYGGYAGLVRDLKRNNDGIAIYLFTPTKRDCEKFEGICKNKNEIYLSQYVDAIKEVAEHYEVNVVDMYEIEEINLETLKKYTVDGLHLNNKGYELIANEFIKTYKLINN